MSPVLFSPDFEGTCAVMEKSAHLMASWRRRALSEGEVACARTLFEDEIDWPHIRIAQAPALGFAAMVPLGRTIVFSSWRAWRDFAEAPLNEQAWLVHELMHVWQAAHGTLLACAKLGALGKGAYLYRPHAGAALAHYNIESQAEIARHLFLARRGQPEKQAPPRAWLEDVWASR